MRDQFDSPRSTGPDIVTDNFHSYRARDCHIEYGLWIADLPRDAHSDLSTCCIVGGEQRPGGVLRLGAPEDVSGRLQAGSLPPAHPHLQGCPQVRTDTVAVRNWRF